MNELLNARVGLFLELPNSGHHCWNELWWNKVSRQVWVFTDLVDVEKIAAAQARKSVALPPVGSIGNMGPRNVEGPGTWQFDVSLSRTLRLRETQRLEVRAEAYNLTNSFRPGEPSTNFNQNTFGQIRTAHDPRIPQFALKYIF